MREDGPDRVRVEALFEAALQLGEPERDSFIAAACGGDQAMERAVRSLLAAHAVRGGVLERAPAVTRASDPVPERLGAYRVLRELGRGGMGVVYDAERDDGQFRRRVAIKLLRGDSDPELRQRVLAERQILAALDHPGIARLLDGGVTGDGRPFLVMEHVAGLPVDVYCERMRLSVAERLRLFCAVARAVDFAHRNLVVHRDLKPSNILVTADGRVKLLDFGVAKLLNSWATGTTAPVTRERLALTPEYASPEQLSGDSLTTTTDVYSLGVVLYELLTGSRPYAEYETSPPRLIDAVCNREPVRASERVLRSDAAAALAQARQTTPQRLARLLRGDLDAILAMALRPEPARRYGSAELLAQDIERHLGLRRVHARQGSRKYAFGKLLRRHSVEAAAVALVTLSLLVGAGAALWQARAARAARDAAERAGDEAARVTAFLVDLFEAGQPEASLAGVVTARDLVERGVRRIDVLHDQPALQAPLLATLSRVLSSLAEYGEAQQLTERALGLYRMQGDSAGVARMYRQLGAVQRLRGDYTAARQSLERAVALLRSGPDGGSAVPGGDNAELGAAYHELASVAVYLGELDEARSRAEEAFEIQRAALGSAHPLTLNSLRLRGELQRRAGDVEEAERTLRSVIELRTLATGSSEADAFEDQLQLADLLRSRGQQQAAEELYTAVLARARQTPDEFAVRARARTALAALLAARGELAGAESLLRELHEERRTIYGAQHPALARSAGALGGVLLSAGDLDGAEAYFQEAADSYRGSVGTGHLSYANAVAQLAAVAQHRGSLDRADSLLAAAIDLRIAAEGPLAHGLPDLLRRRAVAAMAAGRYTAAEGYLHQALDNAGQRGYSAGVTRELHAAYAALYRAWGREADADRHAALARPPEVPQR